MENNNIDTLNNDITNIILKKVIELSYKEMDIELMYRKLCFNKNFKNSLVKFTTVKLKRMLTNDEVLSDYIECNYGLLDSLNHEYKLLSNEQYEKLISCLNKHEQNDELFEILNSSADLYTGPKFLQALRKNNQGHIANYIINNGNIKDIKNNNRPLNGDEHDSFNKVYSFLVNNININRDFLDALCLSKCILLEHKMAIEKINNKYDQVRLLLNIIQCKSLEQVINFNILLREYYPDIINELNYIVFCKNNGIGVFSYGVKIYSENIRIREMQEYILSRISTMSDDTINLLIKTIKES